MAIGQGVESEGIEQGYREVPIKQIESDRVETSDAFWRSVCPSIVFKTAVFIPDGILFKLRQEIANI